MICDECESCPIEDLCDEADRVIDESLSLDGEHELLLAIYEKGRADALKEAFDKTYTKAYDSGYQNGRKDAIDELKEIIKIRLIDYLGLEGARKYGNKTAKQQENSYAPVMKYEIADTVDDMLDDLERMKEQKNG